MTNYDDVIRQLTAAGLVLAAPLDTSGAIKRVAVDGDREKRGWYALHEIQGRDGHPLLIGSFGIWRGNENNASKISLGKDQALTGEQLAGARVRLAEDRRRVAAQRKAEQERAARKAENTWKRCDPCPPDGIDPDYLRRKGIGAHGLRYTPSGALALPIHDAIGRIHGLQFILSRNTHGERINRLERDKEYWPKGLAKQGHFFLIGSPTWLLLVAEGYATAASLHEATGHPVAVAFDAGNLLPVCQALRKRYPGTRILVCADDDYLTAGNPGVAAAGAAALAVSGGWVAPRFADDRGGKKITDFNDLCAQEGLLSVRTQIEAKLLELAWAPPFAAVRTTMGGEGSATAFLFDLDILLDGFTLIYGTDTVFDGTRHRIVGLGPLRSAAGKSLVRMWLEHPGRRTVLPEQVGFDPSAADSSIRCNLWSGWPTRPKAGVCDLALELLEILCNGDDDPRGLFDWVIKWLAYPIQNPGAKMATALLVHGPEGTGKNTFFGAIRRIYGRYGCQFSQVELESNFNGWASGKLLALGNEVVSRAELYHIQGRLKSMITEPEWIINEKMLPARAEQNHCNFVFFSNRIDIAKLDSGDRRYCVIWTPPALDKSFYAEVAAELRDGGVEALHNYLLHVDLTGFGPHTPPPRTRAKADLIELGMDSTDRFWRDWTRGDIDGIPCIPCLSQDLYELYRWWALREGIPRYAQKQTLLTLVGKKPGAQKRQERYMNGHGQEKKTIVFPPNEAGICQSWPNDGRSFGRWLGDNVSEFSGALTAAKNG